MEQIEKQGLKYALISGQLNANDFLVKIFEIDQASDEHTEAVNNLATLKDEEVRQRLQEPEEIFLKYCKILSLTNFHIGQIEAMDHANPEKALNYFEEALAPTKNVKDSSYQDWVYYVSGTIAYFKNNLDSLSDFIAKISDEKNKKVLERLLIGLTERGEPDYIKDY